MSLPLSLKEKTQKRMSRLLNTNKNVKHFQVRPDFRTIYASALFISNTYMLLLFVVIRAWKWKQILFCGFVKYSCINCKEIFL